MYKNYKGNKELTKYFEENVAKMSVAEPFKPILVDILQRRSFEYGLTAQNITQDMNSLLRNLKAIEIRDISGDCKWAAGVYNRGTNTISLSRKVVEAAIRNQDYEYLYSLITHEVYHALNKDEYGWDRLESHNKITGHRNSTLHEAIVEKSSDRCVNDRIPGKTSSPYYHQNKGGYMDTFVTDMMASSYGVFEKQFLKHAIMGRENLASYLSGIGREDKDDTITYLDGIELNFARLHKVFYPDRNEPESKTKVQDVIDSVASIYRLSEWRMQIRMANFKIDSIETAQFFEQYFKYNHNKMYYVADNACNIFGNMLKEDIKDKVLEESKEVRQDTTFKINVISQVLANRDKMPSDTEAIRVINAVKANEFTDEDMDKLTEYGIDIQHAEQFTLSPDFLKSRREQDFSEDRWDNNCLKDYMENVWEWQKEQEKIARKNKFKNFFTSIKRKLFGEEEPKSLGPASGLTVEEMDVAEIEAKDAPVVDEPRTFGSLSKEELEAFRQGEQKIISSHKEKEEQSNGTNTLQPTIEPGTQR